MYHVEIHTNTNSYTCKVSQNKCKQNKNSMLIRPKSELTSKLLSFLESKLIL